MVSLNLYEYTPFEIRLRRFSKSKLGSRIGHLDVAGLARINQAILIVLRLAR